MLYALEKVIADGVTSYVNVKNNAGAFYTNGMKGKAEFRLTI